MTDSGDLYFDEDFSSVRSLEFYGFNRQWFALFP
jgi:hypothetical protein